MLTNVETSSAEKLYRNCSPGDRRRLQGEVVEAYRPHVARLARRLLRGEPQHWGEAEQVGAIGVLVALSKYDPSKQVPFWACASACVRDEIQRWLDVAVYYRRRSHKAADHAERTGDAGARLTAQRMPVMCIDLVETLSSHVSAEDTLGDAEARALLDAFVSTLSPEDSHLLLCEKRDRGTPGNNNRARRYLSLVERAKAFVRGSDDDGDRRRVRGDRNPG